MSPYKRTSCSPFTCGKHTTCSLNHSVGYNSLGQAQYRGCCQKCGYTAHPHRLNRRRAQYIHRRGTEKYSAKPRARDKNEIRAGICAVQGDFESEGDDEFRSWQETTSTTLCVHRQPPPSVQGSQRPRPAVLYETGNGAMPAYPRKNPGYLSHEEHMEAGDPRKYPE